ncbi:hypothetical protein BSL82_12980 [Tardibacter chloracetimidivorans]|uniref:Uncharacterized protein n=1 Tax=Tardibacter chloracetimidivorans TaxID=1921510 RepID=A0A1L3ZWU0_9SPHN|nr:hypothetical protein BSL82_12980 [Tardibacter chloracetimidivorans]
MTSKRRKARNPRCDLAKRGRVALTTETRNPCFPPFEKEQYNDSGVALNRKNVLFAGSDEGGDN